MSERGLPATSTVWMNVTTSANWKRPAVGIVRVEQQLFQALQERLGHRLQACIIADGKFVRYEGFVGAAKAAAIDHRVDEDFVWPDPSFGPAAEPAGASPSQRPARSARQRRRPPPDGLRPAEFRAGDTLVSVGLDWEWELQRLDTLLYELKTKRGVNVISCCYDLIPILFPQFCVGDVVAKFQEYFTNLSWGSSGILCISRQTQTDYLALAHRLGMPLVPTKVMLLGNSLPEGDDLSEQVWRLGEQRFILFVGTIERRKNHDVLYKALHLLGEQGRLPADLKLVFVGMPGWGVDDLLKDIAFDPLTAGHIVQLHKANDADLRHLYERCEFFVYPSFYEGWGLPVAEALALGKFGLASDRGSIPEIAGALIDYVDPWNATAWAHAILRYWNDPALLAQRSEQVKASYRPIAWDEAAATVLELAGQLADDRAPTIVIQPGYDMLVESGLRYGARIVATGATGLLCFGPYVPLQPGVVAVEVEIEVPLPTDLDLVFLFAAEHGEIVLKQERLNLPAAAGVRILRFELGIDTPVDDFELVIEDHAGAMFSLNTVTIRPL